MPRLNRRNVIKGLALGAMPGLGAPFCAASEAAATQAKTAETWPAVDVLVCGGGSAVIGVRETRRIRGVAKLEVEDLLSGKQSPRGVVRGASFPIDIHNPDGIGQAQGVSAAHPLGKASPTTFPTTAWCPSGWTSPECNGPSSKRRPETMAT